MKYICVICGFTYEENIGCLESNIIPGTSWKEVPHFWTCPECGASKEYFELVNDN